MGKRDVDGEDVARFDDCREERRRDSRAACASTHGKEGRSRGLEVDAIEASLVGERATGFARTGAWGSRNRRDAALERCEGRLGMREASSERTEKGTGGRARLVWWGGGEERKNELGRVSHASAELERI